MTTAIDTSPAPPTKTTFPISRLGTVTNHVLALILAITLVAGPVAVLYHIIPSPLLPVIPLVSGFIAIEAMLTSRWLNHPDRWQINRLAYRIAEWVVILAVLRLLVWALDGGLPTLEQLYNYLVNPLDLLDTRYVAFVFFSFVAWDRAETFTTILSRLSLSDSEVDFYSLPAYRQSVHALDRPMDPQRTRQFQKIISNWIFGSLVLVVCAAITTFEVPDPDASGTFTLRNLTRLGLQPEMLLTLLVYFLAGLWLIARTRLLTLRTRWIMGNIQVHPRISRVWNGASLLVLLAVATLATLFPIGSTTAGARIIGAVITFFILVVNLLIALVSLVIYLLLSLLGQDPAPPPEDFVPEQIVPPEPQTITPPNESAAVIFGALFWVVVIGVVIAAFIFFLRGRGVQLDATLLRNWWHRFIAWLRELWRGAADRVETLNLGFRRTKTGEDSPAGRRSPFRFIRLNALSAQAQIRYFYLSTIRRAGERGVSREESETPSEFARDLKEGWPEVEGEIEALTDAFLRARYSADRIEKEDVSPVKQTWRRVRSSLRRRRDRLRQTADDGPHTVESNGNQEE
jgi:hypothetical protein